MAILGTEPGLTKLAVPMDPLLDHGKWMVASKKINGTWKTQCDIFNSDMPMPGMR